MKKILASMLCLVLLSAVFISCGKKEAPEVAKTATPAVQTDDGSSKPTIRLLTDATGIDDKSFNAAAWRGIVDFYGDTVENTPIEVHTMTW